MKVVKLYRTSNDAVFVNKTANSVLEFVVVYDEKTSISMSKLKQFLKAIPMDAQAIAKIQYNFQERCEQGTDYQSILWCYPTVDKESLTHSVANCLIPYPLCYHGELKNTQPEHECIITVKAGEPLFFPVESILDITVHHLSN